MFLKEDIFPQDMTMKEAAAFPLTPGSFPNITQVLNLALLTGLISK